MKQLQNCLRCCSMLRKLTLLRVAPVSCRSTHTMSVIPHRTCLGLLPTTGERTLLLRHMQSRETCISSTCRARSSIGGGRGPNDADNESPANTSSFPTPFSRGASKKNAVLDSAWTVRLANENGYLSWCRNTYLASAVACGMQAEGAYDISQVAAHGVFLLAGLNLTWGTISYVTLILELRRRVHMSAFTAVLTITGATLHLLAWLTLVTMYLGLSEEDPEPLEELPSGGGDRV